MASTHEQLLEAAREAAREVFEDESVSAKEVAESLESLIGDIEIWKESLHVE